MRSNMKPLIRLLVLGILFLGIIGIAGCSGGLGGAAPTNPTTPAPTADWTFLVFLNSDNDLEHFGYLNVKQMEQVGSTDRVNVVVQWDRQSPDFDLFWSGCRRYLVKKDTQGVADVQSVLLQDMGDVDMGSPATLVTFVKWGMTLYPARKYAVILWDHGSGWRNSSARKRATKDISWDQTSNTEMTTVEMTQAFQQISSDTGVKMELVGMDACLMSSMEVSYDLRNYVNFAAYSEANEPGTGWPYQRILADLTSNPGASGADLGLYIVQGYSQEYPSDSDVTQSAIALSRMDSLGTAINNFSTYALTLPENQRTAIANSIRSSQTVDVDFPDYVDLGSFTDQINASTGVTDATLKTRASEIRNILNQAVVSEYHSTGHPGCTGLTIWIPNGVRYDTYSTSYSALALAIDTNWNEFLNMIKAYYP